MLPLKLAKRELRGGLRDFRLFLGCLIIGVAVIAAVGNVSRHIEKGIRNEAKTLLDGDVQLSLVNQRASKQQLDFLHRYGRVSLSATLRAMAAYNGNLSLVEIKGVDENYPLLGRAELGHSESLAEALAGGRMIAESSLLERLNTKPGDTVMLGIVNFTLADTLTKEPDSIANPLSLGPRVMTSIDALEKGDFLVPSSLVRYHYHVLLNDPAQLAAFKTELAKLFPKAAWTVKTSNENNRGVQDFVERLQLFMTLAGLSSLLIGGIGIMNATETYLKRQSETIAILKTIGAARNQVLTVYSFILLAMTLTGSFAGAALGLVLSIVALPMLADFLPVLDTHITFDVGSFLLAFTFGLLTVATFSIAALSRGVEVKPATLFRGAQLGRVRVPLSKWLINTGFALALIATLVLNSSDKKIAIGFIGSALVSFALFAVATTGIRAVARHIHPKTPWMRLAIANLYRPGAHTLSIMLSTGIGLTVLIALLQVEGNFQKEVDETMPALAPSLFLIDIQPAQKDAFLDYLSTDKHASDISATPMIRGRIAKLNGVPVEKINISSDAKWAIESDRGFTYAATPPANSRLVEGTWWSKDYHGKPLVSLDRKLAKNMGLKLGDSLTINILGKDVDAEISSLRDINYLSFQINFALILSPGALEEFPANFIATVHVDSLGEETQLIRNIAKDYPNISSIRLRDSIAQIKELIGHIAVALRVCAGVTLVSGIMVLASSLAATLQQRIYDTVVLKVLGARKADIVRMFLAEWLLLATLTAIIASVLGSGGAWLILRRLDWIEFHVIPGAIAQTVCLALTFICGTGFVIHTRIFRVRAASILRNE